MSMKLSKMTKKELLSYAKEQGLTLSSKLTKEDLINELTKLNISEDSSEEEALEKSAGNKFPKDGKFIPLPEESLSNTKKVTVRATNREVLESATTTGTVSAPQNRSSTLRSLRPKPTLSIDKNRTYTIDARDRFNANKSSGKDFSGIIGELVLAKQDSVVLTAPLTGYRTVKDPTTDVVRLFIILNYRGTKVLIEDNEFFEDAKELPYGEKRKRIRGRVGSEVDFVPVFVQRNGEVGTVATLGSRTKAMRILRERWFFKSDEKDASGKPIRFFSEGRTIEVRVVTVRYNGIFVEFFGAEAFLPNNVLSQRYLADARTEYKVGQKIQVMLQSVENQNGKIIFKASRKELIPNPLAEKISMYAVGDQIAGTVTRVDGVVEKGKGFLFVKVDDDVDIYCTLSSTLGKIPIAGDRVLVHIKGVHEESLRLSGEIIYKYN